MEYGNANAKKYEGTKYEEPQLPNVSSTISPTMGTCPSMGTSIRVRVPTHILKNQDKICLKNDDGPAVENEPVTIEDYTLRTNNRYSILNNEEALITYKEYINELEEKNAERQPKYRHYSELR